MSLVPLCGLLIGIGDLVQQGFLQGVTVQHQTDWKGVIETKAAGYRKGRMAGERGQTVAVDGPRPGDPFASSNGHGFSVPIISEGAAGGHGDDIDLFQCCNGFLADHGALLLGM